LSPARNPLGATVVIVAMIAAIGLIFGEITQPMPITVVAAEYSTMGATAAKNGAPSGTGPVETPVALWRAYEGGRRLNYPRLADGTLYAYSFGGDLSPTRLLAFDAVTGARRWDDNAAVFGWPVVDAGVVVVEGREDITSPAGVVRYLYGLDGRTRATRWRLELGEVFATGLPTIAGDVLYLQQTPGTVSAVDARTGVTHWRVSPAEIGVIVWLSVADGIVVVRGESSPYWLLALRADTGEEVWRTPARIWYEVNQPALAGGRVYLLSSKLYEPVHLVALDLATGAEVWRRPIPVLEHVAPAIADGIVFMPNNDGVLRTYDAATGAPGWTHVFGAPMSAPTIAAGIVYLGAGNALYALDARTGAELWRLPLDGDVFTPAVGGGIAYVATSSGRLYAIGEANATPAGSPVPSATNPEPPATPVPPAATPAAMSLPNRAEFRLSDDPRAGSLINLTVAPDGRVWAYDANRATFIITDADGNVVEEWTPGAPYCPPPDYLTHICRVAFLADGGFVLVGSAGKEPWKFDAGRAVVAGFAQTLDANEVTLPWSPIDVAVEPDGRILVLTDDGVFRYEPAGGAPQQIVEEHYAGILAPSSRFVAIAVDERGGFYVADTGLSQVRRLDAGASAFAEFAGGANDRVSSPMGVAVDEDGNVYVADTGNNRVAVFDPAGQLLAVWTGAGDAAFDFPFGIALDGQGNAYVLQYGAPHVVKFRLPPIAAPEP
jgi:outer membrane protein assembly factor BamB